MARRVVRQGKGKKKFLATDVALRDNVRNSVYFPQRSPLFSVPPPPRRPVLEYRVFQLFRLFHLFQTGCAEK